MPIDVWAIKKEFSHLVVNINAPGAQLEVKARAKKSQKAWANTPEGREKMRAACRRHYHRAGGRGYRRAAKILLEKNGPICGICGGELDLTDFHVDHIRPVAKSGTDDIENLQLAHPSCNVRKGADYAS